MAGGCGHTLWFQQASYEGMTAAASHVPCFFSTLANSELSVKTQQVDAQHKRIRISINWLAALLVDTQNLDKNC